jgi:long-chain acyl-CoA synthetase
MNRQGLKKGDRIAFLMHNCPEFVVSFYAAMKLGLITVSLNIMFKEEEIHYVLEDSGAAALIIHAAYLDKIHWPADSQQDAIPVVVVGETDSAADEMIPFGSFLDSEPGALPDTAVTGGDTAMIGYTSGTTGFPKGAVHTHENIVRHLQGISDHLRFTEEDVFLAALPFFQLVAFLIHAGMSFYVGATLVILEKFEPESFINAVRDEGVTFFAAVPTIYQMLYTASDDMQVDLSRVRFGICAGSPLSPKLRGAFEKTFQFRIMHCYGMTEIALIAACESPDIKPEGVSVGRVLPYVRLRIVDEKGEAVSGEGEGEIQIGDERALKGYWNNRSETEKALRGGWFATGDMGRFDHHERLYIVDRKKDMIIRGGFNVYPAEIERVLLQDPRVLEVSVLGVPHERLGEVPKAYVVSKPGETVRPDDLIRLSREKLANFKALEEVEMVDADFFPRNALGKIMKAQLKNRLRKGV